jgi:hypothetical protein
MSIRVTTRLIGIDRLRLAVRREKMQARGRVIAALHASGMVVEGHAKMLVQRGPATGRVYRKYNPNRIHQASRGSSVSGEGNEAPATDTGELVASIGTNVRDADLVVEIYASAVHARPLEYGTENINPRPFMRRALSEKRAEATATFHQIWRITT